MMQLQRRSTEALARIRTAVMNQEHALAEQRAQMQAHKAENPYDDDYSAGMYQEEFKGGGGFAGPDSKKRRGVCSSPSSTHSSLFYH
jgi:hypothetical protein